MMGTIALSAVVVNAIVYPFEVAQVRLAADTLAARDASYRFSGLWSVLRSTVATDGRAGKLISFGTC